MIPAGHLTCVNEILFPACLPRLNTLHGGETTTTDDGDSNDDSNDDATARTTARKTATGTPHNASVTSSVGPAPPHPLAPPLAHAPDTPVLCPPRLPRNSAWELPAAGGCKS